MTSSITTNNDVIIFQSFVKKHSQNLHPNHYYLMDVKLALSQMIGGQGGGGELHDLHEKDIVQKQKLCMEILNVANKISPGMRKQFSSKSSKYQNYIRRVFKNILSSDLLFFLFVKIALTVCAFLL